MTPAPSPSPITMQEQETEYPPDAAEAVVHLIPIVLPAVGAAMMLLLAFIAVFMA